MNISFNDAIELIQKELDFYGESPCPSILTEEFYAGFITGLEQAIFVLHKIKLNDVPEQKDGKSEV